MEDMYSKSEDKEKLGGADGKKKHKEKGEEITRLDEADRRMIATATGEIPLPAQW